MDGAMPRSGRQRTDEWLVHLLSATETVKSMLPKLEINRADS